MASTSSVSFVVFVLANILFASVANACKDHPPPPPPSASKYHPSKGMCPKNGLKLNVCADILKGLATVSIANSLVPSHSKTPCCTLIKGLTDLDAAVCLCTAIKARVLNVVKLDMAVSVKLILNKCEKKFPYGFKCAY